MSSVNKVMLLGNLGRDPEVRHTDQGKPVVTFSMATTETWKDKNTGERKDKTEWHRVVIFNESLAKVAEQYLKKGSKVFVEGKMRTRKWTDKEGVEKYATEVVLESFSGQLVLLNSSGGGRAPSEDDYGTTRTRPSSGSGSFADEGSSSTDDMDDEIPF